MTKGALAVLSRQRRQKRRLQMWTLRTSKMFKQKVRVSLVPLASQLKFYLGKEGTVPLPSQPVHEAIEVPPKIH